MLEGLLDFSLLILTVPPDFFPDFPRAGGSATAAELAPAPDPAAEEAKMVFWMRVLYWGR
jgi:hypothetical protein